MEKVIPSPSTLKLPKSVKRWICVYPAYLDTISIEKGRKINKKLAVENPPIMLMAEAVHHLNLECIVEADKSYPRDFGCRGRLRVRLFKNKQHVPCQVDIPDRNMLLIEIAKRLPSLISAASTTASSSNPSTSRTSHKGKKGGKSKK